MTFMHTGDLTDLVKYITAQMETRHIEGVRALAAAAKISPSAASALLKGKAPPRAETLQKVAEALQVDEVYLLRLAGYVQSLDDASFDPSARYIAQRISLLPKPLRDIAIDAVSGVVDGFWNIAEGEHKTSNTTGYESPEYRTQRITDDITAGYDVMSDHDRLAALIRQFRDADPEGYQMFVTELFGEAD